MSRERVRFYRAANGAVMLRGARVAFVQSRAGRGRTFVAMIGVGPSIPELEAMGVHGCVQMNATAGGVEAFFGRVANLAEHRAQLEAAFDVVVDESSLSKYTRELEFVASLIEWGRGQLPTREELDAYDRGFADAPIDAARRAAEARAEAHREYSDELRALRAQVAALTSTIERQRKELAERSRDTSGLEAAERQRAADLATLARLERSYTSAAENTHAIDESSAARRRALQSQAATLHVAIIEIQESEVSQ